MACERSAGYRPRSRGGSIGTARRHHARVSTADQSCERQIAELTAFAERGYARVSTADQSCERQIAELTAFAERGIFKETASGARNNRLARSRVLELAQARRIDAILVTELSRWGRSTQDLLDMLYKLAGWKVSVIAMSGMKRWPLLK